MSPLISCIIPCVNESRNIRQCIESVKRATYPVEVIVVDGGSKDDTPEIARHLGAHLVHCIRSRGRQLNKGAERASGDYLIFLHADSILPHGWDKEVRRGLTDQGNILGAFTLKLSRSYRTLRIVESMVSLRSSLLSMPYGDQGLFLRRGDFFERLGGFKEYPIMEDFDLVRRARGLGKVFISPLKVLTSSRRWERHGVFKTTVLNQAMILGFILGISPQRLARLYYSEK